MRTRIVILAAGKGKRMQSDISKALLLLKGKPLLMHLVEAVQASGVDSDPVIVVGENEKAIRESLGDAHTFIRQHEQLGTGDAVKSTREVLRGKCDAVLVLYADMPFISPEAIRLLQTTHEKEQPAVTMLTVKVEDFNEWRAPLDDFGRIIRDEKGTIARIVERRDATEKERIVTEVNPSLFCFDSAWLWNNIDAIGNSNIQKEYYLTDLVKIAIDGGGRIVSMNLNPREALGINTQDHLALAKWLAR